jgi:hypothetical protein
MVGSFVSENEIMKFVESMNKNFLAYVTHFIWFGNI